MLSAWTLAGDPIDWPSNPVSETAHCCCAPGFNDCLRSVTTIPETTLIAYAEDDIPKRGAADLVIFDTADRDPDVTRAHHRARHPHPDRDAQRHPHRHRRQPGPNRRTRRAGPLGVPAPSRVRPRRGTLTELPISGRGAAVG